MEKKINLDELLDTTAAAAFLNVAPRVLEAWRIRAEGPNFVSYNARSVRYWMRDLVEFIESHTVTPGNYAHLPQKRRKGTAPDSEAAA